MKLVQSIFKSTIDKVVLVLTKYLEIRHGFFRLQECPTIYLHYVFISDGSPYTTYRNMQCV